MKEILGPIIVAVVIIFAIITTCSIQQKQITDGRFNSGVEYIQPTPEPDWFKGIHPEPPTTTIPVITPTTKKIYKMPATPATPFEEGKKTSKPTGCAEGGTRGVDC